MAHNILEKLHSRRSRAEAADIGLTDRVYQAMMEDARDEIRTKAVAEARLSVQGELSAAETRASTARAETSQAEARLARSEAEVAKRDARLSQSQVTIDNLSQKSDSLEKIVKLEQGTLTAKDLEYKRTIDNLNLELKGIRSEKHGLELEVAKMRGQLSVKPSVVKSKAKAPPITEFMVGDLVRGGPGNRIISATIKPRTN